MNLRVVLSRILDVQEESAKHRVIVRTDRAESLWADLSGESPADVAFLRAARQAQQYVVLRYEPQTGRITLAVPSVRDSIVYLGGKDDAGELVKVSGLKRPSVLYLDKHQPQFGEMYAKLAQARDQERNGAQAVMAVLPGGNRVHDVVVLPPPAP